jgi:hypothetical protein
MFSLMEHSQRAGDKMAIFSQSVQTLDHIEALFMDRKYRNTKMIRDKQFYRIDGSVSPKVRQNMISNFNKSGNKVKFFLISTRAGGIGINLTGANRVIMLDTAWNPAHDSQAVCRVYRFGQTKKTFIYRLVAAGTMERKVYDRQVYKTAMANRVVDSMQQHRHLQLQELAELHKLSKPPFVAASILAKAVLCKADEVLMATCADVPLALTEEPFEHSSFLVENTSETMTEEEQTAADADYKAWCSLLDRCIITFKQCFWASRKLLA